MPGLGLLPVLSGPSPHSIGPATSLLDPNIRKDPALDLGSKLTAQGPTGPSQGCRGASAPSSRHCRKNVLLLKPETAPGDKLQSQQRVGSAFQKFPPRAAPALGETGCTTLSMVHSHPCLAAASSVTSTYIHTLCATHYNVQLHKTCFIIHQLVES